MAEMMRNALLSSGYKMSQAYPLPYNEALYQGLPFCEHIKRTGPYYKTKGHENAVINQSIAYYDLFCKACILENIR